MKTPRDTAMPVVQLARIPAEMKFIEAIRVLNPLNAVDGLLKKQGSGPRKGATVLTRHTG